MTSELKQRPMPTMAVTASMGVNRLNILFHPKVGEMF